MQKHAQDHQGKSSESYETWIGFLGGGLIFLKNSPLLGEMIQFDYIYMYISSGPSPPIEWDAPQNIIW